jgi:hypothetical protein
MDIWEDRFTEVCRRHHDLVAVYESPRGRLALLLRQTLVPLGPEHFEWLAETRATARAVIADLRVAGFDGAGPRRVDTPPGRVLQALWSPDGQSIEYLLAPADTTWPPRFLDGQAYRAQPAGESAALHPVASGDPVAPGEPDAGVAGSPSARRRPTDRSARLVRADGAVLACDRATAASTTGAADSRVDRRARAERYDPGAGAGVHRPRAQRRLTRLLQHLVAREDRAAWGHGSSWSGSTCSGP